MFSSLLLLDTRAGSFPVPRELGVKYSWPCGWFGPGDESGRDLCHFQAAPSTHRHVTPVPCSEPGDKAHVVERGRAVQ